MIKLRKILPSRTKSKWAGYASGTGVLPRDSKIYFLTLDKDSQSREQRLNITPLQSLRNVSSADEKLNDSEMSYAMRTFPSVVRLCESSIPGCRFGVCAQQFIPIGTWIGPYEGNRLSTEDVRNEIDTSYMWEVYFKLLKIMSFNGEFLCHL